jgi:hypothetical protein
MFTLILNLFLTRQWAVPFTVMRGEEERRVRDPFSRGGLVAATDPRRAHPERVGCQRGRGEERWVVEKEHQRRDPRWWQHIGDHCSNSSCNRSTNRGPHNLQAIVKSIRLLGRYQYIQDKKR